MKENINQEQLTQIIAEVDRLTRQQENELSRQQVQEILQDLNLSPELLDEAMIQVQRKKALATQNKRNVWIGLGVVTAIIIGVSSVVIIGQNNQQQLNLISASQSRLTLPTDNGGNLTVIQRQNSPEVYYRVTLQEAPIGDKLSLQCDWINPTGQIAHQNKYQTRQISTSVWPTHCRYQLGPASPAGTWQVKMILGDKILSQTSFTVR